MDISKDRTLNIGSRTIDLNFEVPDFPKDHLCDCYGMFDTRSSKISINNTLTIPEQICATTLHEVCHVIIDESKLNVGSQLLSQDSDEELMVSHMETGLYGFFKNNPMEIAYIFSDILKKNPDVIKAISKLR
jgi:hypothetical protein|tara:strand:+ start:591 stop:986 length:396 start_codon:yes stop_codon:yes gene_type:complete